MKVKRSSKLAKPSKKFKNLKAVVKIPFKVAKKNLIKKLKITPLYAARAVRNRSFFGHKKFFSGKNYPLIGNLSRGSLANLPALRKQKSVGIDPQREDLGFRKRRRVTTPRRSKAAERSSWPLPQYLKYTKMPIRLPRLSKPLLGYFSGSPRLRASLFEKPYVLVNTSPTKSPNLPTPFSNVGLFAPLTSYHSQARRPWKGRSLGLKVLSVKGKKNLLVGPTPLRRDDKAQKSLAKFEPSLALGKNAKLHASSPGLKLEEVPRGRFARNTNNFKSLCKKKDNNEDTFKLPHPTNNKTNSYHSALKMATLVNFKDFTGSVGCYNLRSSKQLPKTRLKVSETRYRVGNPISNSGRRKAILRHKLVHRISSLCQTRQQHKNPQAAHLGSQLLYKLLGHSGQATFNLVSSKKLDSVIPKIEKTSTKTKQGTIRIQENLKRRGPALVKWAHNVSTKLCTKNRLSKAVTSQRKLLTIWSGKLPTWFDVKITNGTSLENIIRYCNVSARFQFAKNFQRMKLRSFHTITQLVSRKNRTLSPHLNFPQAFIRNKPQHKLITTNTASFLEMQMVNLMNCRTQFKFAFKKSMFSFLGLNQAKKSIMVRKRRIYLFRLIQNFRPVLRRMRLNEKVVPYATNFYTNFRKMFRQATLASLSQKKNHWETNTLFSSLHASHNTLTPNYAQPYGMVTSPILFNNRGPDVSGSIEEVRIPRIRFKPGYQRLWRQARTALKENLGLKFEYQYRLSQYLTKFYRRTTQYSFGRSEMTLDKIVVHSRILPDMETFHAFVSSRFLYVNGRAAIFPKEIMVVNDFVQILISMWFYVLSRWMLNWTKKRHNKFKRLVYRKGLAGKYTLMKERKQKSFYTPNWIYNVRYDITDVRPFLEVDYFTLSLTVIYEPYLTFYLPPDESIDCRLNIYRLYNWKYIT